MGCICVEPALALRSADAGPSAACIGELVTRLSCRMADSRAQHMPVGRGTANNGAARCAAVALVVPIVAAVSTDIDGRSADAGPSAACIGELVTRLSCRMADPRAQHMPVGRGTEGAGSAWYAVVVWQLLCIERRSSQMRRSGSGGPDRRRCEHRYRRKWLVSASSLRWLCALPMRVRLLHALAS